MTTDNIDDLKDILSSGDSSPIDINLIRPAEVIAQGCGGPLGDKKTVLIEVIGTMLVYKYGENSSFFTATPPVNTSDLSDSCNDIYNYWENEYRRLFQLVELNRLNTSYERIKDSMNSANKEQLKKQLILDTGNHLRSQGLL